MSDFAFVSASERCLHKKPLLEQLAGAAGDVGWGCPLPVAPLTDANANACPLHLLPCQEGTSRGCASQRHLRPSDGCPGRGATAADAAAPLLPSTRFQAPRKRQRGSQRQLAVASLGVPGLGACPRAEGLEQRKENERNSC